MTTVSVVIMAMSTLIRKGIQQIIAQPNAGIEIVSMFAGFSEASAFLKDHKARVLIIDDSLPRGVNLSKELRQLLEAHPGLALVMIAQRPTISLVRLVLNIGARCVLHRDDDLDNTLIQAIHQAAAGGMTISPRISQLLDQQQTLPGNIDQRDIDVLHLLTDGFQPKEIAAHLGIDRKVVYRVIRTMSDIYDAQNIAQLVDLAHQHKLLPRRKKE